MMNINPFLLTDFYKVGHPFQYPKNTTLVYSNLTPRKSLLKGVDKMTFFGLQYFIKEYLIHYFNINFFHRDKNEVMNEYRTVISSALGSHLPSYEHIEYIHDLGYLPIRIKAISEGLSVPMKVPVLTIVNTDPKAYWLTNFIETLISSVIWQPCTSATIAKEYKKILSHFAQKTGMPKDFVEFQGHDFSFRGMSSPESSLISGMGHLTSFLGTDTIPAICGINKYYKPKHNSFIGGSVPATEHSVMCAGGMDDETETFRRIIQDIYPTGIVSIVSDTWDLWRVINEYLPKLKDIITSRNGKVVIRPDSGDPVNILCGDPNGKTENERKGVVQLLWEVFGGTITDKGYKLLDSHIGVIYGDSITRDRATQICQRLEESGFASQAVFGIGSFTYQYNTRDTFGTAMKSTYVEIDGLGRNILKEPVTDDGTKKSATGLLCVVKGDNGDFSLIENVDWPTENTGELKTVFLNGVLMKDWSIEEIRGNIC